MATNTSESPVDLRDPRAQFLVGVLLMFVGIAGLAGYVPSPMTEWQAWFLYTFLFFFGSIAGTVALTNVR